MTNAEKLTLAKHACHIRMGVIEGTHSAKCGHPGGSLDIAEVLSYLYFVDMNVDPEHPKAPDRDRLVLSKGHAAPGLYAALAERGYFPVEDLKTLRKIGSYLQGHPNMNTVPGVDMSTGSLGQGISAACGMALGAKLKQQPVSVYAIVGDGEVEEGECWEAFMFASHYKLSNLCVFLDRNHLQIDGTTETVMDSHPLEEKLKAFNFNVLTINGHDYDAIESAIKAFHAENDKPTCIILDTIKGKGVSFMENAVEWHGTQRQTRIKPLVEDFFAWAKQQAAECAVPPKSRTGQGLNFVIHQENYLKVFLTDGDIPIDNSASERAIRTFCIGKKNWMFHNTAKGAGASALVYSISETAKLNNLRPYYYFRHILTELPKYCDEKGNINPAKLDQLMPWAEELPEECRKPRRS